MSKTRSYVKIFTGSWLFLTAMAIHLSLRVARLDLQQGGNSRITNQSFLSTNRASSVGHQDSLGAWGGLKFESLPRLLPVQAE